LDVKVSSIFELDNDQKAVTMRATFGDATKTLPPERIKELENCLIEGLKKTGYLLRG